MRYWPFARVVSILTVSIIALRAEQPFDFASTPGKLPKQVVPTEYAIRIIPNLEAKTFTGNVIIKIKVSKPVRQLVLNALELELTGAMVDEQSLPANAIKLGKKQELLTLTLASELSEGDHAVGLNFIGKINQGGIGLFYATYVEQG